MKHRPESGQRQIGQAEHGARDSTAARALTWAKTHLGPVLLGSRLTTGDRYAIWVALGFKLGLLMLGALSFIVFQNKYPEGTGLWPYIQIWNRWDGTAYFAIADHGYTNAEPQYVAFFPLFPFLARLARPLAFNDTLSALFAVSTVASLFTAVQFYRLVRLDLGPPAARRAVWFLFAFPTAYFLHIGYTEGLFLALVFAAMTAARTGHWWRAGIIGAFAAMTRMNGALLLVFFAAEALQQGLANRRFPLKSLASMLTVLGTGVYLLVNYIVDGNALAFMDYQKNHWHHNLAAPWVGVAASARYALSSGASDAQMVGSLEAFSAVFVFAVGLYALRMRPIGYALWTLANVLLWTSNDFLLSGPRYAIVALPVFLLLGRWSVNRNVWASVTAVFVLMQGLFAVIFAQGRWAF